VGFLGDKKRWQGVDFAGLVPRHCAPFESGDEAGRVVLLQPRYQGWLMGRLVQPRLPAHKKYLKVPLEERGSFLWALVDGQRTVADLVAAFVDAFPVEKEQAGERVAGYLYNLEVNGFLEFTNLENT
jgi:hypothetical protein